MTISSRSEASALLLQPILYGERGASDQYIGGEALPVSSVRCEVCGDESRQSLARFHVKASPNQQRVLHVVTCTKASCWNFLFRDSVEDGNICLGGKGVLSCTSSIAIALQPQVTPEPMASTSEKARKTDEWSDQGCGTVREDAEIDMESLEAQLAAMERRSFPDSSQGVPQLPAPGEPEHSQDLCLNQAFVFPRYDLYSIKEPNAPRSSVTTSSRTQHHKQKDTDKIQAMLDRYLADETDESIRSALEAAQTRQSGISADDYYFLEDEAPTADYVLHNYKERLYRAPRQVIRVSGTPLWSAPLIFPRQHLQHLDENDDNEVDTATGQDVPARLIPLCETCGAHRSFVAQLLPTLLHTLHVDSTPGSLNDQFTNGAMDFGNIMLYACSSGACRDANVFCIVQKPVDEVPTKQRMFKLVNFPDETGIPYPTQEDDQATNFTDGCVDDDYTIDGDEDEDELW